MVDETVEIGISAQPMLQDLEEVNAEIDKTELHWKYTRDSIYDEQKISFQTTMSLARNAYTVGIGMVKAAGVSISYFFRSMISAAFGAIAILTPILTAEAVTPGMQVQAALGFFELGVAIAAVIAAQSEESKISRDLRGAAMTLSGIQSMIGTLDGLW